MDRRMMLENGVGNTDLKLIDTITVTPSEKNKDIDMTLYPYNEFFITGNVPKTAAKSRFRVGINNAEFIDSANESDIYPCVMFAHIIKINDMLYGFAGFNDGWAGGSKCNVLLASPRTTKGNELSFGFYPFVAGDEQAIVQIYAR